MPKEATTTGSARTPAPRTATVLPRASATIMPDDESWFTPAEEHPEFVNVVYWGLEGSAKTTDALMVANVAPDGSKVLAINAEGGIKTSALRRRGIDTSKIVIYPPAHDASHRIRREDIAGVYRRLSADLHNNRNAWFSVLWDSGTEVAALILDQVQDHRVRKLMKRAEKPDEVDQFFVDRDDYGTLAKMARDLLRDYRDLPCHFVMTCLLRKDIDKATKKPVIGPAITPKVTTDVLGYSDFIIYTKAEDEDGPWRGMTKGSSLYRVKDRFGCLPRVMVEPSMDRVLAYYNDQLTEKDDPLQKLLTKKAVKSLEAAKLEDDEDKDDEDDSTDSDDD